MHHTRNLIGITVLTVALLLGPACDGEEQTQDSGTARLDSEVKPDSKVSKVDIALPDKALPDAGKCDPKTLSQDVMTNGKKVLNGVTLKTSTTLAELKTNGSKYSGKTVRIEGFISTICQTQGCYITLKDSKGNECNLKVTDGTVDFRTHAKDGVYAIGEGVYTPTGGHGAQVFIDKHGAMIGSKVCTP